MRRFPYVALTGFLLLALVGCATPDNYDVIIQDGQVYDGSGATPRSADIGIRGDEIAVIGDLPTAKAPVTCRSSRTRSWTMPRPRERSPARSHRRSRLFDVIWCRSSETFGWTRLRQSTSTL